MTRPLPLESSTVPPVQLTGAPTFIGEWLAEPIQTANRKWLGGGGGSMWFRDTSTAELLVIPESERKPTVLSVNAAGTQIAAIDEGGNLALFVGTAAKPGHDEQVNQLVRADALGKTTQNIRLGWKNVVVVEAVLSADGSLFALVIVRDQARIGRFSVTAAQHGQIFALVALDASSSVSAVTPLQELLPGWANLSVSDAGAAWILGHLRDSTAALAVTEVQAGHHVLTRALRWRDDTGAYSFRTFHGPFALSSGATFAGDFSELDWGEGPYRSVDGRTMMLIGLEHSAGNIQSALSLPSAVETAKVLGGRLLVVEKARSGGYRVLALDLDGSVLGVTALDQPEHCSDLFEQHLFSLANHAIGMFVTCGAYGDSMLIQSRAREIGLVAQLGG